MSGTSKVIGLVLLLVILLGFGVALFMMISSFGFLQSEDDMVVEVQGSQNNLSIVWNSEREGVEDIIVENSDTGSVSTIQEQGGSIGISRSTSYIVSATLLDRYGGTYEEEIARVENGSVEEL